MVKITFDDSPIPTPEMADTAGSGSVELSSAAAARIAEILKKKETPNSYLRVRVDGGGCNGYSYKFLFEETAKDGDIKIEKDGVTVIVDTTSYNYLQGSIIDYVETLEASQFVINNPNAKSQCGCGSSFSL